MYNLYVYNMKINTSPAYLWLRHWLVSKPQGVAGFGLKPMFEDTYDTYFFFEKYVRILLIFPFHT